MFNIIKIKGDSLSPLMKSGDYAVILTRYYKLKVDDIIIVEHPSLGKIIKRITIINDFGEYLLKGENANSISPEKIGWINPKWVLGVVKLKIKKRV